MKIQGIYKIINCINGKVYIGQSIDINKRFYIHKRNAVKNQNHPLYHSTQKYGLDNFDFIIIELVTDYMKLDEREQYWMDFYKSYDRNFGYNLRPKAESNRGYKNSEETRKKLSLLKKGKRYTEEHKRKISESNKGKKLSKEHRLKISLSRKGKLSTRVNYKHSDKTKVKIGVGNKGKIISEKTKQKMIESAKLRWQKRKNK